MAWIPHLMVLDDDPRVLESLIPSFATDLTAALGRTPAASEPIRRGDASPRQASIKISAHGYESSRLESYRFRPPHQVHLHLVRERTRRERGSTWMEWSIVGSALRPHSSFPSERTRAGPLT